MAWSMVIVWPASGVLMMLAPSSKRRSFGENHRKRIALGY
jgi:hypothetical protein